MYESPSKGGRLAAFIFLVAFCGVAFLATTPTSIAVQSVFAVLALAAALVLRPLMHKSLPRLLFLLLCSLVTLRYLAWRYFSTLPGTEDPVSFAAAALLLAAETWMIAIFLLGAFMMADPQKRAAPPPTRLPDEDLPSVDVLVPSLNEPADLLAVTLAAAKRLDYPADKLTVVLCDDGGTDIKCNDPDPLKASTAQRRRARLTALCEDLGVVYRTRPANVGAKAGNINEALLSLSGELVAIFDADHAPTPDFLRRTVGYFGEDERLFLVQTPHMFLNPDPIARNLGVDASAPPENEMFYGQLHDGLGRWDGAFFCGSAALLRRHALDEVGGISGETITEDAETALELHARGWRSIYVNHAMVAGLQPETFGSLIGQRGRWATGMIQILLLKNPLFRRGLRLSQRLCYLNSMAFWFFPLTRMIMLAAPLAYLLFDIELFVTTQQEALAYMLGYIGVSLIAQHALFSRTRWPFQSEIYEIAQTPYLLRAVFGTMLSPRGARFKVTAKDELVREDRLSEIARPLIVLFLVMAGGAGLALWRYLNEPGNSETLVLVGAWATVNMLLTGAALGAVVDRVQRRAAPRVSALRAVGVDVEGHEARVEGRMVDVSTGGAAVDILPGAGWAAPSTGAPVRLSVDDHAAQGSIEARVVGYALVEGVLRLRLAFTGSCDATDAKMRAALVHADSRLWEARRAHQMRAIPLLYSVVWVLQLFVIGVPRVMIALLTGKRAASATPELDAAVFPVGPEMAPAPSGWSVRSVPPVVNGVSARAVADRVAPPAPAPQAGGPLAGATAAALLALGLLLVPSPTASQGVALPELAPEAPLSSSAGGGIVPVPAAPVAETAPDLPPAPGDGVIRLPDALPQVGREAIQILPGLAGALPGNGLVPAPGPLAGGSPPATEPDILVTLRSLRGAGNPGGMARFDGEWARQSFLLIVPEGARPASVEIAFQNSAFVLPDASRMRVLLNGTVLGQTPLGHITERDAAAFDIPPLLPLYARNIVTVEVAQLHRLFCGARATFDLWTEVDLGESGVRLPARDMQGQAQSTALARIAAVEGGRIPVTAIGGPSGADALGQDGARDAAVVLRDLIGGPFSFVPAEPGEALVEFARGARPQALGTASGLRIVLGPDGAAPIAALRALGATSPEVEALLARESAAPDLPTDTPTPLGALGLEDGVIANDRWVRTLTFSLPADYLPAGGNRAELSLTYAHVAGLPAGSALRVLVNGTSVRMIPANAPILVREQALPVRFDAGLLGAGRNTLTLQFERSAGSDPSNCGVTGRTFAEIGLQSTLSVPGTPAFAVRSFDGVLATLAAAQVETGVAPDPFGPGGAGVDDLRTLTVASALRAVDGLAARSSRTLRVVPEDALGDVPLGRYDLLGGRIAGLVAAGPTQRAVPMAEPEATPAPARTAPLLAPSAESAPLLAPPAEDTGPFAPTGGGLLENASDRTAPAPVSVARADILSLPEGGPSAILSGLRTRILPDPVQSLDAWLHALAQEPSSGRIALVSLDESRPEDSFLLAGSAMPADIIAGALAAAQAEGGRLTGHIAVWSAEQGWSVWHDPYRLPTLIEPLRPGNAHAVIGAYAEQRPLTFVGLIFAIAFLVAAIASSALIAGRRPV